MHMTRRPLKGLFRNKYTQIHRYIFSGWLCMLLLVESVAFKFLLHCLRCYYIVAKFIEICVCDHTLSHTYWYSYEYKTTTSTIVPNSFTLKDTIFCICICKACLYLNIAIQKNKTYTYLMLLLLLLLLLPQLQLATILLIIMMMVMVCSNISYTFLVFCQLNIC